MRLPPFLCHSFATTFNPISQPSPKNIHPLPRTRGLVAKSPLALVVRIDMEVTTPPSRSKRSRVRRESIEDETPRPSRRRASKVESYAEESSDEDNIFVAPGPGALLDEVESQVAEEEEVRCVCGATKEDEGRRWVQCDRCDVWLHMDCMKLSPSEAREKDVLCNECSPYPGLGAAMSPAEQPGLPVRSASMNVTTTARRSKGERFNALSYYKHTNDFSVKGALKRVTFSPDSKHASENEDEDPDAYNPSNEEGSDGDDEEDYPREIDKVDYRNKFDDEDYANEFDDEDGSPLFVSPSPTPSTDLNGVQLAKRPRPPGVTDLGERIVQRWIAGGYAAEIDAENNAVDWGSDVSEIDIPEMSEGLDLMEKIAEQDLLIFSLKKKLEKRGERIASLKQQVMDLERENAMLKGME